MKFLDQAKINIAQFEQQLAIPNNFIQLDDTGYWVWRLVDGKKQHQTVKLGSANHTWRAVLAGLDAGDEISL